MTAYRAMTLASLVQTQAARSPDSPAIRFGGTLLSYRDLTARIARVANLGTTQGLREGDVALLCAPNSPDYIAIVLGLSAIGVAVATPSPALTQVELNAVVTDCAPRIAILDDAREITGVPVIRVGSELDRWLSGASDRLPDVAIPETATFAIAYTSGTTGRPKGVMLSHRSRALTALAAAIEYRCFGPGHQFLALTPLCHGAGLAYAIANLVMGGVLELECSFDVDHAVRRLASPDVTGVFVVPTMLRRMLDGGLRAGPRLTGIVCNAAALPQPLKARAVDLLGYGLLHETYGSTEAGIVANLQPPDQLTTRNSVGRPFLNVEVSLRDADGNEVSMGSPGELFARGPYGFNGYLGRHDATADAIHDGWITVGDLAVRDDRGFLHIVDRKGDMIVTGGINVYPREVETVLLDLPDVADAGVIGVPDVEWGERVHAVVVRASGSMVTSDGLLAACAERLAPYKRPKTISFSEALPRSSAGKLLRGQLMANGPLLG